MSTDTTSTATATATTGTAPTDTWPASTAQRIQLAVRATPEQVWTALTDGAVSPAYYYGFTADYGDLRPGSTYRYTAGGGTVISGHLLEVKPGRRLVATFDGAWDADVATLPTSTVAFDLLEPTMPMPGVTVLSCTHTGLPAGPTAAGLEAGWVTILSGLKTLLETGQPMVSPPQG